MHGTGMLDKISEFEKALAKYTGAPYAIMTDCCTHAIEMCLRYDRVRGLKMTPFTYLSIPMTMHKLGIDYVYLEEDTQTWRGEYNFGYTRIWDSARRLEPDMYKHGQMQCLSFGHTKPLQIGHGGAILLDNKRAYDVMIKQRYDGRDLNISPWEAQKTFQIGYHYRPAVEDAVRGLELLAQYESPEPVFVQYPDLRTITIKE
jgi:dTDP-4-amino-4,6-dideoxygalactose transaminase